MREGRKTGAGLFDQFCALLDHLGIQVDFEETQNAEEERRPPTEILGDHAQPNSVKTTRDISKLTRRVSFDSVPHILDGRRRNSVPDNSFSVRSQSQDSAHWPRQRRADIPPLGSDGGITSTKSNLHPRQVVTVHELRTAPHHLSNGVARHPHDVDRRQQGGHSHSEASDEDSATENELVEHAVRALHSTRELAERSNLAHREMDVEAQAFRIRSVINIARSFFHRGMISVSQSEQLGTIAHNHDTETLLRQAIEQWRASLASKRQLVETERFFEILETRAGKARDIFLLTKAFTHWAQSASEEVVRTSAARRHILRTRYFNAWKDITVVNELKVRRQALIKPFNNWKHRTAKVWYETEKAKAFNQSRLIARGYQQWFRHFWEQRSPLWYTSKLKLNVFSNWVGAAQSRSALSIQADELHCLNVCRKMIRSWSQRSQALQQGAKIASDFRFKKTLIAPLEALRTEVILSTPKHNLLQIKDSRITRSALDTWAGKSSLVLRAGEINDLRIMRNAFTMWNDNTRCQELIQRSRDRVVLRILYKWSVAEKFALWKRHQNDQLAMTVLNIWRKRSNDLCADLGHAKYSLQDHKKRQLMSSCLKIWSSQTQSGISQELRAGRFRARKLAAATLRGWVAKGQHLERMHKWASDARFYIICGGSTKTWQQATASAKRSKRREAYLEMRRKIKMRLARQILQNWKSATSFTSDLHTQAIGFRQRRLIQVGTNLFEDWRSQAVVTTQANASATGIWRDRLLQRCLQVIAERQERLVQVSIGADVFAAETVETIAAGSLRKLNWKLFQIKRQQETAESLELRNRRKHYRNILRYWADKSAQRRRQFDRPLLQDTEPQSVLGNIDDEDDDNEDDQRSIDFNMTLQGVMDDRGMSTTERPISTIATPGYLRTPSRRGAKARTRFNQSTTPATMHQTSFMNRLLGTDQTTQRIQSARGDFARRLGESRFSGFADIPETSPLPQA